MTGDRKTPTELYNGYKDGNYEAKRIVLTSPMLHIGAEVSQFNHFEYIKDGSKVYLPHRDALAKALLQKGRHFLENHYLAAIKNNESIDTLLKQAFGEEWYNMQSAAGVDVFPDVRPIWTQDREYGKIKKLRPMIRNGMGQLYIPGSSIKGAIRTAIAYYLLKHGDRYKVPPSSRVSEIEKELRKKMKKHELKDKLFMSELFSKYDLCYQNRTINNVTPQNSDILRAVKVSDSQPLISEPYINKKGINRIYNYPIVAEVIVSSYYLKDSRSKDKYAKYRDRASIYAEMVKNVRTEFTITLDIEMLSWFHHCHEMKLPFNTIEKLISICQEFAQEQWNGEFNYWQEILNNESGGKYLNFDIIRKFYDPKTCPYNLRVGWGCGMTGTTIDWLFQRDTRIQLRDACGRKAASFDAPKSRRTIVGEDGEIRYVPGWVNFDVLS